jgi:hypothetical protein
MNNRKFLVSMTALVAALATESTLANTDTSNHVNLAASSQGLNAVESNQSVNQFNFVLKTAAPSQLLGWHSSHSSHSSHASHSSHSSHYSSYQ